MRLAFSITREASDEFNVFFAGLDVCMPLRTDPNEIGVVLDDDGRDVLTIDVNGERDDVDADRIAQLLVATLNKIGGFPHG